MNDFGKCISDLNKEWNEFKFAVPKGCDCCDILYAPPTAELERMDEKKSKKRKRA